MNQTQAPDMKVLHSLIDELIIYINLLNKSPEDRQMTELFGTRFFRSGQLLYACGHSDLSELARDIYSVFRMVFNQSAYATQQILSTALSFLVLARKALMFSDAPDFSEVSEAMIAELRTSLQQLCEKKGTGENVLQTGRN
jgi:hypothetical protein